MKERYEIKTGRWGMYFYDSVENRDLDLNVVCARLNLYANKYATFFHADVVEDKVCETCGGNGWINDEQAINQKCDCKKKAVMAPYEDKPVDCAVMEELQKKYIVNTACPQCHHRFRVAVAKEDKVCEKCGGTGWRKTNSSWECDCKKNGDRK